MKHLPLTNDEINALNPAIIAVALLVGGNDVLTQSLDEIIEAIRNGDYEEVPADIALDLTNVQALDIYLKDVSGNSFDIIVVKNETMLILDRIDLE